MNAQVETSITLPVLATAVVGAKSFTAPELLNKSCDQAEKSAGLLKQALTLFSTDYKSGIKVWPYGALPKRLTADKAAGEAGNYVAGARYRAAGLLAKYNSIWKQLAANGIQLEEGDTIVSAHKRAEQSGLLVNGADGKPRMGTAQGAALDQALNGKDKGAAMAAATASADMLEVLQKLQRHLISAIEACDGLKGPNSATMRKALDAQLRQGLLELQPYV